MDDEGHPHKKGKLPASVWMGLALVIAGILIGAYIAPALEPFIHPERAALVERAKSIESQNGLLKSQIDCLVNGINAGTDKVVDACT